MTIAFANVASSNRNMLQLQAVVQSLLNKYYNNIIIYIYILTWSFENNCFTPIDHISYTLDIRFFYNGMFDKNLSLIN